ncbi:hypothetical protein ACIQXI_04330 [Lysinibacillus sp. NPDC097195]|uniref:hypothetical protein n=1 Tax=Lysinibacillus sp. NPDC097195 TaxID=3364141 RepID=UPI0038162E56
MKKIVISILTFSILVILPGCNSRQTVYQPEGTIIIDSQDYLMIPGDYSWKEKEMELTTLSTYDIEELAEQFETLEVVKNNILTFEITKSPSSISVTQYHEDGTSKVIETTNNQITMPNTSGTYIYEVKARWPEGKINFVFDVNVK